MFLHMRGCDDIIFLRLLNCLNMVSRLIRAYVYLHVYVWIFAASGRMECGTHCRHASSLGGFPLKVVNSVLLSIYQSLVTAVSPSSLPSPSIFPGQAG